MSTEEDTFRKLRQVPLDSTDHEIGVLYNRLYLSCYDWKNRWLASRSEIPACNGWTFEEYKDACTREYAYTPTEDS